MSSEYLSNKACTMSYFKSKRPVDTLLALRSRNIKRLLMRPNCCSIKEHIHQSETKSKLKINDESLQQTTDECYIKGLIYKLQLTTTEFIDLISPDHKIYIIPNNSNNPRNYKECTFDDMVTDMHKDPRNRDCPKWFAFSISNTCLANAFGVPDFVKRNGLFEKYWPRVEESEQIASISQQIYCIQQGHKACRVNFAGASQWFQIVSGSIELTLYEPTDTNLTIYAAFCDSGDFKNFSIDDDTASEKIILKSCDFFYLPTGCIYQLKAIRDTHIYTGQFFHLYDIVKQIECLARDACRSEMFLPLTLEIVKMYWFTAINTLNTNKYFNPAQRKCFMQQLEKWKNFDKLYHCFAPLNPDLIISELSNYS